MQTEFVFFISLDLNLHGNTLIRLEINGKIKIMEFIIFSLNGMNRIRLIRNQRLHPRSFRIHFYF